MNVVFIVLDTVRKDRLGVYNDDIDFTPHLDAFARDCTVYEDAVSQAPWTLPSHASMFTGQYPWEHGATQKNLHLDTDETLLAERFQDAGYRTACYTSNVFISPYTGMADGFDDVDNFFGAMPSDLLPSVLTKAWRRLQQGRSRWLVYRLMDAGFKLHERQALKTDSDTPTVRERATSFIDDALATDDDFFLFLNFMDAHLPYAPPEEYRERHAPNVDPADICQTAYDHNGGVDAADFDALQDLYDAEIDYLDDQLGLLFDALREQEVLDETVVVIVSDHGENLGEDDLMGHQFSVSEPLVSVPLMVRTPDGDGDRIAEQIELRQLYGMVPDLAGLDADPIDRPGYALGGYAYPRLDLQKIPDTEHERLGAALRFARRDGKKLVRRGTDDPTYTMTTLDTGDEIAVDDGFRAAVDGTGESEDGVGADEHEEQVKQRLADLGYV